MVSKKFFFLIASALILNSCHLFKKTSHGNGNLPMINLDTVVTKANIPDPLNYQASATRINDIIHTKLDVSFDWGKQYMYGKATLIIKPYFYPTSVLTLDARGMQINEVSLIKTEETTTTDIKHSNVKGKIVEPEKIKTNSKIPLQYKYEKDIITIQLDKEYKNTEEYTVFIEYVSKPNELKKGGGSAAITDDKGLYFINPDGKEKNKPQEIWTQGETQSSSVWFPTIDHPNERMTQEIYLTVDKKYVTLSNGELCSTFDNGDGTRTDYWKMELPHAPYLAMMAVGDFAIVRDKWRGKEVNYYVEKEYEPYARDIFGHTPDMLEFFSNKLGVEYAWNKYSQIVARDYVSGAMENTTATLHSEYLQRTDRELLDKDYEDYVSHELFHQWFGDLVTCESWSNLPLNESFATYGEYLWQEHRYGLDAADQHSAESREGYLDEAKRKQECLIRFQFDDKEDMFDGHSYNKGGQVLHMLRKYVGDDAFFASLKLYLETNKFSSVEIHNLRLAFEKVTGEDLNWFFNQWFLSPGHPELVIKTEYDIATKKQKVHVKQVQDFSKTPLFKIPMYVDLYLNGKVDHQKITITKADETFEFTESSKPDLVNVDAEKMLLCTKEESKSIREWAFQYRNAPLYLDRYEAISELAKTPKDSLASKIIISALDDKFWSLRSDAIDALKNLQEGHEKEIEDKLKVLAQKDEKSLVRAAAIDYLALHYSDSDLQPIYKNGLNDRSYAVLGSSLSAIAKADPAQAMKIAKDYENEKSADILFAIADLYAKYGSDVNSDFFFKISDKFSGFSKIGYLSEYTAFLKRVNKDETVNVGIDLMVSIAKDEHGNNWVTYYAKKYIQEIITMYDDRIASGNQKIIIAKQANPNAPTHDLESQVESSKAQKQKIEELLSGIK
jgi:aminopeptidase N